MMQTFRKNTRLILFIALASFALLIFFQWGLDITGIKTAPETNIAVIDGVPVPYTDYLRYAQTKENEKKGISRDDIWAEMIDEMMWHRLIQQERVAINDVEIWSIIRNNPPRQIVESEYFRNAKGEFDFDKYLSVLRAPESQTWLREYEQSIRRELPKEKIRSLVSTLGWVSPYEESIATMKQAWHYDFTHISIPLFKLAGRTAIDTVAVRRYYEEHREDFTNPELTIVKFVLFDRQPSATDTLDARERMEDFLLRLKEGEDFLTVAREVSDDTLIELSFSGEAELPHHLAAPYRGLKNGQHSALLTGPDGYEVIKRIKNGLLYRVTAAVVVSPSTIGEIQDKIEAFRESAEEIGFEKTAAEYGMAVRKSYPLNPEKVSFPVRNPDMLASFLKKKDRRSVAGPLSSPSGYYLVMVDSVIEANALDFTRNFQVIKARFERENLKAELARVASEIYRQLTQGKTMEMLAFTDTSIILQKDSKNIFVVQNQFGYDFAGALAALDSGQLSPPLVTDWSAYIIRCDNKVALRPDSTAIGFVQVMRQMRLQNIGQQLFTPRELKDNRDKFFE